MMRSAFTCWMGGVSKGERGTRGAYLYERHDNKLGTIDRYYQRPFIPAINIMMMVSVYVININLSDSSRILFIYLFALRTECPRTRPW